MARECLSASLKKGGSPQLAFVGDPKEGQDPLSVACQVKKGAGTSTQHILFDTCWVRRSKGKR